MWKLVALLGLLASPTLAQSARVEIADLRTGVADDGTFISPGQDDDDYVLISGPGGTGTYPRATTVPVFSPVPPSLLPDSTWLRQK
jgi:hypothetical protein